MRMFFSLPLIGLTVQEVVEIVSEYCASYANFSLRPHHIAPFSMFGSSKVEDAAAKAVERVEGPESFGEEDRPESASSDGKSVMGSSLPKTGLATEDVFAAIKEAVVVAGGTSTNLPSDSLAMVALTSHSVAAQLTLQPPGALSKVISRIYSDTSIWISRLFRYRSASSFFHEDSREGLIRIARMLMHAKYPDFKTKGYEAILAKPPVIYVSSACRIGVGQYLCSQLGLPASCLSVIPTRSLTAAGSDDKIVDQSMDLACLEEEIKKDTDAERLPLLVLALAGTPALGHADDLESCLEMCRKYGVWVHAEGNSLATLPLSSSPNVVVESFADSVTLAMSSWLHVPALPHVTLYRPLDSKVVQASGLNSVNMLLKLACLPLWTSLVAAGSVGITRRLHISFKFVLELLTRLKDMPRLVLLTPKAISQDFTTNLGSIGSRPLSIQSYFSKLPPVVIFKYVPAGDDKNDEDKNVEESYCDNLNSWLGQILKRDYGTVHNVLVDALHSDEFGVALQFMPFDFSHWFGGETTWETLTDEEINSTVEGFADHLRQQLLILDATVGHRRKFRAVARENPRFQLVDVRGWAGLGAVRYIPRKFLSSGKAVNATADDGVIEEQSLDAPAEEEKVQRRMSELTESERQEIDKLNIELVVQLRGTDAAFSKGEGDDGLACVRFGMVMEGADVAELISAVLHTAEEIEDSSQFVESMAEVVRQGIVAAETALKKENEEKIWQEGILRHVPLVGSVFNWLSPLPKETGIKGRTFHLDAGVIESTENIYKYHMQLNFGERVKAGKVESMANGDKSPRERAPSVAEQFEQRADPPVAAAGSDKENPQATPAQE